MSHNIVKCPKCGHHNIDLKQCYNCLTVLPAKRFLGVLRTPDGKEHVINEDTPVSILLDVIEDLHRQGERERKMHSDSLSLFCARGQHAKV